MGIPIISDLVENTIGKVVDKALAFIPDPELKAKAAAEIRAAAKEIALAQIDVNKAEAQHQSIFVAGWRPWIGWCCGASFAYTFIAQPIVTTGLLIYDPNFPIQKLPTINWQNFASVLMGMLGLGG
jgi:hypothetical protein